MLKREELVVGGEYICSFSARTVLFIGVDRAFFRNDIGMEASERIDSILRNWSIKPKPKPRIKGWMNIYANHNKNYYPSSTIHRTKISADQIARSIDNRVACIEIDAEEGEGL